MLYPPFVEANAPVEVFQLFSAGPRPITFAPAAVSSSWVISAASVTQGIVFAPASVVSTWTIPTQAVAVATEFTPAAVVFTWVVNPAGGTFARGNNPPASRARWRASVRDQH